MAVRLSIRASIPDLSYRHLMCSLPIAPIRLPASLSLRARIFSKVLPKQLCSEIERRLFATEVLVCPGFGMGTHLATFQFGGKEPYVRRLEKRVVRRSWEERCTTTTIAYEILSDPVAELSRHVVIALNLAAWEAGQKLSLRSWRGGGSQSAG